MKNMRTKNKKKWLAHKINRMIHYSSHNRLRMCCNEGNAHKVSIISKNDFATMKAIHFK